MKNQKWKMAVLSVLAAVILAVGGFALVKLRNMYQSVQTNVNRTRQELADSVLSLENTVNAMEAQMKLAHPGLNEKHPLNYDWVKDHPLIAHALGGVTLDGYVCDYTNSQEAFQENYAKGIRVFEVDLMLSSDGGLVAVHDWDRYGANGPLPFADFQQGSFYDGQITQMTGADVVDLLIKYPEIYLVTDSKYTDVNAYRLEFSQLVYLAKEKNSPDVLDRIIVQVYNQGMYDILYDIYPWKSVIYTTYQSPDDFEDALTFCKERGIRVFTTTYGAATEESVAKLKEAGIDTYVHTVNDPEEIEYGQNIGIAGFYTDSLSLEDLKMRDQ